MAEKLTAPRMGEGVEELALMKWLKEVGDEVEELEPIVEVETDKVVTELPSPASGVILDILIEEGNPVKVGQILAWIGDPGEDIPDEIISHKETEKPESDVSSKADFIKQPQQSRGEKNTFMSPLVRKMLEENNLSAEQIVGTGKDGRITKRDVIAYLESDKAVSETQQKDTPQGEKVPAQKPSSVLPISNIRRTIAERMIASQQTSAHVLTVMEADLTKVAAHRAYNKPLFAEDGIRLTLTAYFISAIVAGLKAFPKVNSSWSDHGLILHPSINIGMAVSLGDEGLIVPVIKEADTLSLLGIAQQVHDLAERARAKKLKPEEVRGGTFSLTNHGMSRSLFATPIITQPQVGILGTGIVQKRAVVVTDNQGNDMIAIRPMVYLSFVFDHRVLDGEGADRFLARVVETLENWN